MLLNARFAAKRLAHDVARVVVAVAAQILNGYRRVGQAFLDQLFDLARIHRHGEPSLSVDLAAHEARQPAFVPLAEFVNRYGAI